MRELKTSHINKITYDFFKAVSVADALVYFFIGLGVGSLLLAVFA